MMSNEEVLKFGKERYRLAREHTGKWKKRAKVCYDFYAGRQWDEQDQTDLEATGRAPVVMNRIKPRVEAVVGMEVGNRQEIRYSPREAASTALIDLFNKGCKWSKDACDTEDHETHAFRDATICGMGWTRTVMDYADNLDGVAATVRRSPLQYDWDQDACQPNLADARVIFFSEDMDPEDAKAMFPGQEGKFASNGLGVGNLWEQAEKPDSDTNEAQYPTPAPTALIDAVKMKKVRIVEMQYHRMEPVWRVMAPDGSVRRVKPEDANKLKTDMEAMGRTVTFEEFKQDEMPLAVQAEGEGLVLPYVKQTERVFYRAFFSGSEVLEHDISPMPHGFMDNCITGWWDETDGYWFGMVEGLIAPAQWANKFFSQAIYIYTVLPKGGVMAEKSAIKNLAQFRTDYASPDSVAMVEDGALSGQKIIERKPGQYPPDLDKLTAFAIESLPALDGLNPEVLGMAGRDQPGVLEKTRKQAGMTILAPLFDSLRRYRKRQGRVTLHYIGKYYTDSQLGKIAKNAIEPALLQELRSQDARDYEVVVDDAPNSPNSKEYVTSFLTEWVRQAPQIAPALAPVAIKYSSLPLDAQKDIMQVLSSLNSPTSSPQYLALQQAAQKLQQENMQLKAGTQAKMMQTQVKAQSEQAKHELKVQEAQANTALTIAEMRAEMALEREKIMQEARLEVSRMLLQAGLKQHEIHLNHEAKMAQVHQGGNSGTA